MGATKLSKNKKIIGIIIGLVVVLLVAIPIGTGKLNIGEQTSKIFNKSGNDKSNESSKGEATSGKNIPSKNRGTIDGSITDYANTGEEVSSNYNIPDGELQIQRVKGYTGIYIEDGSDKEVENVAAIQVKNNSEKTIEFAQVQLYNGDKKLIFDVTTLPANSSAVVMDINQATLNEKESITYGGTSITYMDKLQKSSDIKYTKVDNNGIKVTNKSKKEIPCIRIFYKFKSPDGYYVGGITYTAKVEDLKSGESKTIYPSHFDSDGGEIMMVKTYDSKDE